MPYAICRIEKLKTFNSITLSGRHTDRTQKTSNANPDVKNIELIPEAQDKQLEDIVRAKIGDIKHRKDAILCAEYFLGASPEFFRPDAPERAGYYHKDILDQWIESNLKWLQEKHDDNLVKATVHLDEITPHIAAYIVPIHDDPKEPGKKKLSYKVDFGGSKYRLQELQDDYAQAMAHLGLKRGEKGSKATHQDTSVYYMQVNANEEQRRQTEATKLLEQKRLEEERREIEEQRRQLEEQQRQWWAEDIATEALDLWLDIFKGKPLEHKTLSTQEGYTVSFDPQTKKLIVLGENNDIILTQQGKAIAPTDRLKHEHFQDWRRRRLQKRAHEHKHHEMVLKRQEQEGRKTGGR